MTRKYIKLSEPIKTSISNLKDLYDRNGQWLPPGNYYFLISEMGNKYALGELNCNGFKSQYTLKMRDVISMMAIAQARLARRAEIEETMMPKYRSPNSSIELEYPSEIALKRGTTSVCTICLEPLTDNYKVLSCNHKFHMNCITQWYNTKKSCPVCRKNIVSLNDNSRYSVYNYPNNRSRTRRNGRVRLPSIN